MERWESHYINQDTPWDKGAPSPGLEDFLASGRVVPPGSVCVPGCGLGHDVRAWARKGFAATGYDIAPTAVLRAREEPQPEEGKVSFLESDFLKADPEEGYDWVFEHTFYCAIQPDERPAYVEAMLRFLKPGGSLLAVHYMIPDEDGPPFGTNPQEVEDRFSPVFKLIDSWEPRTYPNRQGLERMYWWQRPH